MCTKKAVEACSGFRRGPTAQPKFCSLTGLHTMAGSVIDRTRSRHMAKATSCPSPTTVCRTVAQACAEVMYLAVRASLRDAKLNGLEAGQKHLHLRVLDWIQNGGSAEMRPMLTSAEPKRQEMDKDGDNLIGPHLSLGILDVTVFNVLCLSLSLSLCHSSVSQPPSPRLPPSPSSFPSLPPS